MVTTRRTFLGMGTAAGLAAGMTPSLAFGQASIASVASTFGPPDGLALLSRNENPYGPAPSAIEAIAASAKNGCYYANRGLEKLTAMIAERHGVSPKQVVLGSGSTEILCAIALAWGAKGKIVAPGLFWDSTVKYGEAKGVSAVRVPLASDMSVDLAGMEAAFNEGGVSLVHVCNPNNPTGMVVPAAQLRALAAKVTPTTTLLVDEAYNELTDDPEAETLVDLVREGQDVIVCRTFSKIYGMAGMRVGYALTSEENAALISTYLMSFGGNVSGLAAAIAAYDDYGFLTQSKAMVQEGRQMILDAVATAGLTALPSQTNFVYVEVPDANAVQAAMAERDIAIRGAYGEWTQYSRVSCGYMEDVARYAAALPEIIDQLRA